MSTIQVKPHPGLDRKAWPLLKHPASGGLLNADKEVPAEGRPWLNDGFTARMLTDGAIIRGDHPDFDGAGAEPKDKADEPSPALPSALQSDRPKPLPTAKPQSTEADAAR